MEMDGTTVGNIAWVLTSTALVLLMTPGLAFYYGGLVKGENVVNTMLMSIIAMGAVTLPWFALGFSLAFDEGPFIGGFRYAFLDGVQTMTIKGLPGLVFVTFQGTFPIVSAAIISGAVVERMCFSAYVSFIVLWSLLVYSPVCHWVWGPGGWIGEDGMKAKDYAGGMVVHEVTAASAFMLAVLLGPRQGFRASSKVEPHNVPFVILGGSLLWFGWSGFNGGSALAASAEAGLAVTNTYLSAASSLIAWAIIERVHIKSVTAVGVVTGAIVGLVIVTPGAGYVAPVGAVVMGAVGCALAYPCFQLNKSLVDDTLDCLPCHGATGFIGTVFTGLFAVDGGLFYGGGFKLLGVQCAAAVFPVLYAAIVSALLYVILSRFMPMRVSDTYEAAGLDFAMHGGKAYRMRHSPIKPSMHGHVYSDSSLPRSDMPGHVYSDSSFPRSDMPGHVYSDSSCPRSDMPAHVNSSCPRSDMPAQVYATSSCPRSDMPDRFYLDTARPGSNVVAAYGGA